MILVGFSKLLRGVRVKRLVQIVLTSIFLLLSSSLVSNDLLVSYALTIANSDSEYRRYLMGYLRPDSIPFPNNNSYTQERELFGRTLFFDPRLFVSGWALCATCHSPGFSWSDGLLQAMKDEY